MTNSAIRSILLNAKNVVVIGASANPKKDSYIVMKYLQDQGIKIIPINSKTSSTLILGEKVYKYIEDVNFDIDIVNIFRPSSEVFDLVSSVVNKNVKTIWLQLDIFCSASKKNANSLGINFIQNKCTKIEYEKLKYM